MKEIKLAGAVLLGLFIFFSVLDLFFYQEYDCKPFTQRAIPDENDGNWKIWGRTEDTMLGTHYYLHKKATGLKLGAHYYFGKLAFKSWACDNSKNPQGSKHPMDREDHMVALLLEDGAWHKEYAQKPERNLQRDGNGNVISVTITLGEKSRTITRPGHGG